MAVMQITQTQLQHYRAQTFRTAPGLRLTSVNAAVEYVNQRGFVFFWPNKSILMPSLWAATAGDRPVPDEHDDPGHVTWGWKDSLLGKRRWYYGRVLRKRNTMISLEMLPYFYALTPNYGDYHEDYLIDYDEGRLPLAAKLIYEALLTNGPLDTIALRKQSGLTSRASDTEFNRALEVLQTSMRLLPVGVTESGAWHYSFLYDIVARHFPKLVEQAHPITEPEARQEILQAYLRSVGAVPFKEIQRVFGNAPHKWDREQTLRDLAKLEEKQRITQPVQVEGMQELCVAIATMLS